MRGHEHSRRTPRLALAVAATCLALTLWPGGCKDAESDAPASQSGSTGQRDADSQASAPPPRSEPVQSPPPPVNTIPTAAVNAIYENNLDGLTELLDNGVAINEQDANGYSLLHHACRAGQYEIAKFLIERGADINIRARVNITPLISAVRANDLEMCKLLVENGADLDVRGGVGDHLTALSLAVRANHVAIVDYLRSVGAPM